MKLIDVVIYAKLIQVLLDKTFCAVTQTTFFLRIVVWSTGYFQIRVPLCLESLKHRFIMKIGVSWYSYIVHWQNLGKGVIREKD